MKPEEKAKELVNKMLLDHDMPYDLAQECALIAVDELITEIKLFPYNTIFYERLEFLKQVKSEIEKL